MKKLLFVFATLGVVVSLPVTAQLSPRMKMIPAGTAVLGDGYQYEIVGYHMNMLTPDESYNELNRKSAAIGEVPGSNNPDRIATLQAFMLSEHEVTNAQYRDFVLGSLLGKQEAAAFRKSLKAAAKDAKAVQALWQGLFSREGAAALLPDQECWNKDFPYSSNEPLSMHYFSHPAFDNYPVAGVSWEQANAYCQWLTQVYYEEHPVKQGEQKPTFRLPTEAEWEYAALGMHEEKSENETYYHGLYPWEGQRVQDKTGQYLANIKTGPGVYIDDNYEYTAPVKSFPANAYGLYDMAGNVSEWTSTGFRLNTFDQASASDANQPLAEPHQAQDRVVKGGSWADYKYAAMCGSRMGLPQTAQASRVGFRVAMSVGDSGI